jgi:isoquinoline 1-oxidoreductase beta subunit
MSHALPSPVVAGRRAFLKGAAAASAGLVVGFYLPARAQAASTATGAETFAPNAFVRIASDNTVTVIAKHIEFGQGTYTGLATILADELDADWQQVRVESAPADASRYNNLSWGSSQGTGGSSSIANSWSQLRKAGATARAMLVEAAAQAWDVPAAEITVAKGVVSHAGTGRSATFGALATKAAALPAPADVALKDPRRFTLIGTRMPRQDSAAKTDGSALFTLDVKRPGMLTAVIARPPRFGATMKSFDATPARAVKGVVDVVAVPQGVAVLADNTWAALKGREALVVTWDESKAEKRGSDQIMAEYKALAETPGVSVRADGDAEAAIKGAAKVLDAAYEFPFLAHAPMEPVNCVAELSVGKCEIWTGSQLQTVDQGAAARIAGLKPEQVVVHTLFAGGSFGRRATPDADMVSEAVAIAKAIGGRAPVKLVWTREDDIRGGRYRPMYYHRLRAGLDASGAIVGWQHRIVGQSILKGTPFSGMVKDGIDATSVEGAVNLPYAIPNLSLDLHTTEVGVPVLWWRSVGSTHTAFASEHFLDEIARAGGKDPVEFRLAMLKGHPRHAGALALAAEKAKWGSNPSPGRFRGVAVHESFNTVVAQVAEVSIRDDGTVKVERVACAVDCGLAVNPDQVKAQMEGGIGYGLGAALRNAITLTEGRVDQSNFHDYEPLRIADMPAIEVHIVPSTAAPTGVGEPGTPVIAPAVANAILAATGRPVRRLPFAGTNLKGA